MPHLCPQTLTAEDQSAILSITLPHPRDHLILSLALGTGLRLGEIVGLDMGDVYDLDGLPYHRIHLRREIAKGGKSADIFLPDGLVEKLKNYWIYRVNRSPSSSRASSSSPLSSPLPTSPLFTSQWGNRISKRRVQTSFRSWQVKAGFSHLYPFHALRHTAITNVYRSSRDLFLAQRYARHVSPLTTTVYTHPTDEDLWEGVRGLKC